MARSWASKRGREKVATSNVGARLAGDASVSCALIFFGAMAHFWSAAFTFAPLPFTHSSRPSLSARRPRSRHAWVCSASRSAAPLPPFSSPPPSPSPPRRPRIPTEVALLLSGGLVGASVGGGVVAFKLSIRTLGSILYGSIVAGTLSDAFGNFNLVAIPVIGGLSVALLRTLSGPFSGGLSDCVADPSADVRLFRGPAQKTLASVLTLGSGLSLGPEQGAVDIGAVFSRILAQSLNFSGASRELLLSCGAAAGLSAGFNAPIAGVFFALERLRVGDRIGRGGVDAAVVLLAAAISALVAQAGLGSTPAFEPPQYQMLNPLTELPMWMALGFLAGGAAIAFRDLLVAVNTFFASSPLLASVPDNIKPVIGATFCGVTALYSPEVLFFGYETLSALLANNDYFTLPVLLRLLFIKPLCTAICLGSGLAGGTVAPSLFLGALVGASFQKVSVLGFGAVNAATVALHSPFPMLAIAEAPAYALLGMSAVLGGILKAPITSSLLLFELTRDYKICAASMISAGIASAVANYSTGADAEASAGGVSSGEGDDSARTEGDPSTSPESARDRVEVDSAAGSGSGGSGGILSASSPVLTLPDGDGSLTGVDKLLQLGLPFVTPSDAILATMTAGDPRVTLREPLYISASEPLFAAVGRILDSPYGAAIVIDDATGVLVGLLTVDGANSALATYAVDGGEALLCSSACGTDCVVVASAGTAARAREKVRRFGARYAVVVEEDDGKDARPVGIFSADVAERFSVRESLRLLMSGDESV